MASSLDDSLALSSVAPAVGAALVAGYQHEVAVQHRMVLALRHQLVVARHSGPAGSRPLVAGARSNPAAPPLGWGTL